jgi:hypothetical protein
MGMFSQPVSFLNSLIRRNCHISSGLLNFISRRLLSAFSATSNFKGSLDVQEGELSNCDNLAYDGSALRGRDAPCRRMCLCRELRNTLICFRKNHAAFFPWTTMNLVGPPQGRYSRELCEFVPLGLFWSALAAISIV